MVKQQVHIFLDSTTYLEAKSQEVNISQVCNQLLTQYLQVKEVDTDIARIETALKVNKAEIEQLQRQGANLSVSLVHAREQSVKTMKEDDERSFIMLKAARASGILEKAVSR